MGEVCRCHRLFSGATCSAQVTGHICIMSQCSMRRVGLENKMGPTKETSCVRRFNCWLLQPGFVVSETLTTTGSGLDSVGSSIYLPIASALPASHLCTIWMPNSLILGHFSTFLSKICSSANIRQTFMT